MPTIRKIHASHPASETQLAYRSDGMWVVGLMLHEGMQHTEQEHVDYYVGEDADQAQRVFERLTRDHKNDIIGDPNGDPV